MKSIVIYQSKTGFTKIYAHWISENLNCPIYSYENSKLIDLSSYDIIIYGGSLYASGILGLKSIIKKVNFIKTKKLIIFAVGVTPIKSSLEAELIEKNIPEENRVNTKLFFMRGGFNYKKLGVVDKFLMSLMKRIILSKKVENRTPDEKGMLAVIDKPTDFSDKKYINELIDYYKSITLSQN